MKKFFFAAACALLVSVAMNAADNIKAYADGTLLRLALENENSYVAFQVDVTLPEGVSIESGDAMQSNLNVSNRATVFSMYCNQTDATTNTYRIVGYNPSNSAFTGLSALNILSVTLSDEAKAEDITLSNALFVTSGLAKTELATVSVAQGNLGDVNGDGISLQDVLAIEDLKANGTASENLENYTVHNADTDSDGDVDEDDAASVAAQL